MEGQGLVFTGIVEEIGTIESIEQQAGGEIRLVINPMLNLATPSP